MLRYPTEPTWVSCHDRTSDFLTIFGKLLDTKFEEGKRFRAGRKIYFIMDGCARELVGDSAESLFSNDMNIHELTETFFDENDWHIYLQVGSDTQLVQVDGESHYWLIINAEKRKLPDQGAFDEYDFDVEKVLSITHE